MNTLSPPSLAVLITGAGSGIGAATAQLFSKKGHDVVLVGRTKSKLEKTAESLVTQSLVLEADLSSSDEKVFETVIQESVKQFPHLGILVNNAGIFLNGNFLETKTQIWQQIFNANVFSIVSLTRLIIPHFKKIKGSSIVNVASTSGLRPLAGMIAYTTSKASVISLTQSLALEMAPFGIRVNCVCPGIVETPILGIENMTENDLNEKRKAWGLMHPLGRVGLGEDIASSIYHLTQPESGWTTGVVLPVDGGISLT